MATDAPERFIALLRGVNVGGITVKSAALSAAFVEAGFRNVRTVLASGNVGFELAGAEADLSALKLQIEAVLERAFGYDAWIVLRTREEVRRIADAYPFARRDDIEHPYVVFSSSQDVLDELLTASGEARSSVEAVLLGDGVLYWRVPKGSSLDTPFAGLLAKQKYKPHVTTRNLRTVEKLVTV
ncbi:uncharacterized protein (DUF1697 family) [Cryobacterium mesophilum]|uniref:DUF1697 domain-containing protein n=1 Tax=Terrimesophilobacter mesophilus TaxID=433647 RepID=A0A4R8VAC3_9MICO|nr:DUF1697 domain-containing protein [Terrimesophilobacter mesophilus]MBB5632084.1 uncharacterized protein (DUF1697 family) [Terrimesophilobacter mesophilus]TFB78962.1 DUF1697 domain-containing protein [Terrimesophilobacter mesophilus]